MCKFNQKRMITLTQSSTVKSSIVLRVCLINVFLLSVSLRPPPPPFQARAIKREEEEAEEDINDEWKQAAVIIDRLMFWVFMIITVFSAFVILVLVPAAKFTEDRQGI